MARAGLLTSPARYRTDRSVRGHPRRQHNCQPPRFGDLAPPRTGRTIIVITLSNQQGYVSDTCGQAERKAVRGQASRSPFRPRWADPARSRQCHQLPAGRHPGAPGRTGSARRPRADQRACRRARAVPTCAAACAVSSGLRRRAAPAPAPIWSTSAGAIPATADRTSPD
jgi:hypothetical protein